jgi:NAD(P)-dependent dehydrogenase (short-subunit alcohol dehydrogenase family)
VGRAARDVGADPGRLDVLVNNAGIYGTSAAAADTDLAEARRVLEVNLFGAWRLTQAVLPLLRESGHGRVVNVSSGAGQLDDMQGGRAGYRVSKTALNALTRTLAVDEERNRILVNAMCPGWVRTDMGGESALGRGGRGHGRLARHPPRRRPHRGLLPRPRAHTLVTWLPLRS